MLTGPWTLDVLLDRLLRLRSLFAHFCTCCGSTEIDQSPSALCRPMWDCKNCFCFACMIQSNWGRSPSCRSYAFHGVPAGVSGLPGTAVGGLQRGCSTSQMRFCFSHPRQRGRREFGPCTAFLYFKKKKRKSRSRDLRSAFQQLLRPRSGERQRRSRGPTTSEHLF